METVPGYKGSVGERGLVVIQTIEELRLGSSCRRECFGPDSGGGSGGQLVVSGRDQSLLSGGIGGLQAL